MAKKFKRGDLAFHSGHLVTICSDKYHSRNRVTITNRNGEYKQVSASQLVSIERAGKIVNHFLSIPK